MHRTTIMLTSQQLRGLKQVGQESHLSMSALLRMCVTEGLQRRMRQQAAQIIVRGGARRQAVLGE